ncbi:hypothetical protein ACFX2I_020671 [Malus domestica]
MPSKTPTPSLESNHGGTYLQSLLNSTCPFLRGELESVDKNMPSLVAVLRSVGAGDYWHKHNTSNTSLTSTAFSRHGRPLTLFAFALRPLSVRLFLCQPCHL